MQAKSILSFKKKQPAVDSADCFLACYLYMVCILFRYTIYGFYVFMLFFCFQYLPRWWIIPNFHHFQLELFRFPVNNSSSKHFSCFNTPDSRHKTPIHKRLPTQKKPCCFLLLNRNNMALVFLFIYTELIILHVESEQDIIPILYHVFLAFHSHKPFFPRCCQGALLQKVLIIHHFSFNKAPIKIIYEW